MAYFFPRIDTYSSSPKSEKRQAIFNLDEFHTITRQGNRITAFSTAGKSVIIAICKSDVGAEYLMDCILHGEQVDRDKLNLLERGL